MNTVYFFLALAAAVCFALAVRPNVAWKGDLIAAGLLLFTLIWVIQYGRVAVH